MEGLEYNDAALKNLFSYALDEPISTWRRNGTEHLSFGAFVDFLAHNGRESVPEQEGTFPDMTTCSESHHKMAANIDINSELRDVNSEL